MTEGTKAIEEVAISRILRPSPMVQGIVTGHHRSGPINSGRQEI
jgi:hypothetical protein